MEDVELGVRIWSAGARNQAAVLSGGLGLEKDLPGLVTFGERLEGVRRLVLQISVGRVN